MKTRSIYGLGFLFFVSVFLLGCKKKICIQCDIGEEGKLRVFVTNQDYSKNYYVRVDEWGDLWSSGEFPMLFLRQLSGNYYYLGYSEDGYGNMWMLSLVSEDINLKDFACVEDMRSYVIDKDPFVEVYVDDDNRFSIADSLYLRELVENGSLSTVMTMEK